MTLVGTGRPGASIEIVQNGEVIDKIVITDSGAWSYTFVPGPGAQAAAVQYEGQPGTRSTAVTFESTGTQSAAAPTGAAPGATASAATPAATATSAAAKAGAGQAYIVQYGDYLRLLAYRFYGDQMQWSLIYDATNAMAAKDASFAVISDPDVIIPGWKLWIPAQ